MNHQLRWRRAVPAAVVLIVSGCTTSSSPGAGSDEPSTTPSTPSSSTLGSPTATPLAECGDVFSADDGRIAYIVADGNTNGISTVNADSSNRRVLVDPVPPRDQSHGGTEGARWISGDRVLFSSNRAGGPDDWHVFVVGADGGEPTQLTSGADGIEFYAAIAPDGATMAYGKAVATGDPDEPYRDAGIFASDADGQDEHQLTTAPANGADEWPDYSPDGDRIVFSRAGDDGGIFKMNADGSGLTRILGADLEPIRPRWSPDGSRIAFSSNAESAAASGANVWIVNADGSGLRQVTDQSGRGLAYFPDWSPSGEYMVVVYHPTGQRLPDLAVMADTGEVVCLLVSSSDGTYPGDPDWGE